MRQIGAGVATLVWLVANAFFIVAAASDAVLPLHVLLAWQCLFTALTAGMVVVLFLRRAFPWLALAFAAAHVVDCAMWWPMAFLGPPGLAAMFPLEKLFWVVGLIRIARAGFPLARAGSARRTAWALLAVIGLGAVFLALEPSQVWEARRLYREHRKAEDAAALHDAGVTP